MLKHFAVHDYKGLHKILISSVEQATIRGWNSGVMSWARDRRKSSGRHTSHSSTLSGYKLWAQYSHLAGERYGMVPIRSPAVALPIQVSSPSCEHLGASGGAALKNEALMW